MTEHIFMHCLSTRNSHRTCSSHKNTHTHTNTDNPKPKPTATYITFTLPLCATRWILYPCPCDRRGHIMVSFDFRIHLHLYAAAAATIDSTRRRHNPGGRVDTLDARRNMFVAAPAAAVVRMRVHTPKTRTRTCWLVGWLAGRLPGWLAGAMMMAVGLPHNNWFATPYFTSPHALRSSHCSAWHCSASLVNGFAFECTRSRARLCRRCARSRMCVHGVYYVRTECELYYTAGEHTHCALFDYDKTHTHTHNIRLATPDRTVPGQHHRHPTIRTRTQYTTIATTLGSTPTTHSTPIQRSFCLSLRVSTCN